MKSLKLFFLSLILLLSFSTGLKAEFFSDVIVTSASGIWTDARAYSTLNAAVTAVGSNIRTIKIVSPQVVTTLTVPSNVTLEFDRDGSITNSGQLTIQTKNIIAPNRQIFTGAGNIDFASGTVVQTGWFSNIETAFALTGNDTITLIVSKPQTITASYSPGNDVNLKWDSPGNILTVNAGITVANIGQIEAGNYQILAGAGTFTFRNGTELNLSWFPTLRAAITWISTNTVTLINNVPLTVGLTDTIPVTTTFKINRGGILTISGGVTLTVNGEFSAGPYQCFVPTGTIVLPSVEKHYPEWYSSGSFTQATIEAALNAIGTVNKATLLLRPVTWVISSNADWSAYTNVTFKIVPGAVISHGAFTVKLPVPESGAYQIFDGSGLVTLYGSAKEVYAEWWGAKTGDNTFDNSVPINKAILSVQGYLESNKHPHGNYEGGAIVQLLEGIYYTNNPIVLDGNSWLRGTFIQHTGIIMKTAGKSAIEVPAKATNNPMVQSKISDLFISSYDYASASSVNGLYGIHIKNASCYVNIQRVQVEEWLGNWGIYDEGSAVTIEDSAVQTGNYGIKVSNTSTNAASPKFRRTEVSFNDTAGVYIEAGVDAEIADGCIIQFNNNYNLKIELAGNISVHDNYFEQTTTAFPVTAGSKNIIIKNTYLTTIENNYFSSDSTIAAEVELDSASTTLKTVVIRNNYGSGKATYFLKSNNVGNTVIFEDNETYKSMGNVPGVATYSNLVDAPSGYYEHGLQVREESKAITAAATVIIPVSVPGADITETQLIGTLLRVDAAFATGETWNAAYSGGSTASIASNQAVAKNTKVLKMFNPNAATPIPTTYTDIAITRSAGGNFTAQGTIRAKVYFRKLTNFNDAP